MPKRTQMAVNRFGWVRTCWDTFSVIRVDSRAISGDLGAFYGPTKPPKSPARERAYDLDLELASEVSKLLAL